MKHRAASGKKTYVMLGLLAILFISMGYLSMQRREGLEMQKDEEEEEKEGFQEGLKNCKDVKKGKCITIKK
jgi:hypothetical protein